jgi:hypothetical protein
VDGIAHTSQTIHGDSFMSGATILGQPSTVMRHQIGIAGEPEIYHPGQIFKHAKPYPTRSGFCTTTESPRVGA